MTSYYYAVKTLLENNVNTLPLNARNIEVIIKNEGWKVIAYDLDDPKSKKVLEQFNVLDEAKKRDGFSLRTATAKIVFIKRSLSSESKTLILAHELGHIKAGHFSDTGILGVHSDMAYNDQQEREANAFMRHIIAPKCILKELKLKKIDDIKKITLLNDDILKAHYTDYQMAKGQYTDDELALIDNFKAYIAKNKKRLPRVPIIVCTIIVSAATLITGTVYVTQFVTDRQLPQQQLPAVANTISPTQKPTHTPIPSTLLIEDKITIKSLQYDRAMPVYKTKTGTKYHKESCRHLVGRRNIKTMTLETAIAAGMESCDDCFN